MKYCPKCQRQYPAMQTNCLEDEELLLPLEPDHSGSQIDEGEQDALASDAAARWQQLDQLLDAALERAPEEWPAFLAAACAGDDDLRREVESLLATHERAGSFIEALPVEAVMSLFAQKPIAWPFTQSSKNFGRS